MVTEIAQIDVKPGMEAAFEQGVEKARSIFARAKGFHHLSLLKSIEKPQRYRLMIEWESYEAHMTDFYGKDDWKAWRALVGDFFDGPPQVDHSTTVIQKG